MTTQTAAVQSTTLESLVDKTIMIKLDFGLFGNYKKANVDVNTGARADRFKHQKRLLNSPELEAIRQADSGIKDWVARRCLPYDIGVKLVPDESLDEVYTHLEHYADVDRPKLIDAFIAVYMAQRDIAEADLKEQFRHADYPSEQEMRSRFYFTYKVLNFGVPGKLKKTSPAIWKAEKEKAAGQLQEVVDEIKAGLRLSLHEMVSQLADKLSPSSDGKQKRLHDKTIENLQLFLNTFDIRNVTDDVELKQHVDNLKLLMAGVNADKIKENDGLKIDLQKQFSEVTQKMTTMIEVKGRKFRE